MDARVKPAYDAVSIVTTSRKSAISQANLKRPESFSNEGAGE
jgi:hypothetical protein